MEHPLENYNVIATPDFISQTEHDFYTKHFTKLEKDGLYAFKQENENRIMVMGVDIEGKDFNGYVTFKSYFISEYNKLEKEAHSEIHNIILTILEDRRKKVYIKNIIEELKDLQNKVNAKFIKSEDEYYKKELLMKIASFSMALQDIYQQKKATYTGDKYSNTKIKWLGTHKQLGTLFFDLLYGQRGTTDNPKRLKPLIESSKGELMHFLAKNFISSDGSEWEPTDFDDILNKSENKDDQRASNNDLIELNYPAPKPTKKP